MGFSISATIAVLFISFVAVGATGYSMAAKGFFSVQDALAERNKLMYDKLNTAIKILNYTVNGTKGILLAENTGNTVIEPVFLSALSDGRLVNLTTDDSIWFPNTNLNITVDNGSRIKIITGNGVAAYYTP
jgi:flagellar protein FlaF